MQRLSFSMQSRPQKPVDTDDVPTPKPILKEVGIPLGQASETRIVGKLCELVGQK